jgi:dephospho-CoA kinase
MHTSS